MPWFLAALGLYVVMTLARTRSLELIALALLIPVFGTLGILARAQLNDMSVTGCLHASALLITWVVICTFGDPSRIFDRHAVVPRRRGLSQAERQDEEREQGRTFRSQLAFLAGVVVLAVLIELRDWPFLR